MRRRDGLGDNIWLLSCRDEPKDGNVGFKSAVKDIRQEVAVSWLVMNDKVVIMSFSPRSSN